MLGKHSQNLRCPRLLPLVHRLDVAGEQLLHFVAQLSLGVHKGLLAALQLLLHFFLASCHGFLALLFFLVPLGFPDLLFLFGYRFSGRSDFLACLGGALSAGRDFILGLLDGTLRFLQLGPAHFHFAHRRLVRRFRFRRVNCRLHFYVLILFHRSALLIRP